MKVPIIILDGKVLLIVAMVVFSLISLIADPTIERHPEQTNSLLGGFAIGGAVLSFGIAAAIGTWRSRRTV